MRKLISINFRVEVDGDDHHIHDDTQTHGNNWGDVYKGMLIIRDELNRQIDEKFKCPYHPKTMKNNGQPDFDK